MSRPGPFGSPFCLGFDEVERLLERMAKASADAYPPLNIEEPGEGACESRWRSPASPLKISRSH